MKYILGIALLGFALSACTTNHGKDVSQEKVVSATSSNIQVIHFTGPMDLTIKLQSADNFETAQMTDNSGKIYHLKRAVSGSGVRLANDDGVSIHFKGGEGIVEFMKDKPISITEVKK